MKTAKKGFTLIELMVAIAIVAISTGIVLTSLNSNQKTQTVLKIEAGKLVSLLRMEQNNALSGKGASQGGCEFTVSTTANSANYSATECGSASPTVYRLANGVTFKETRNVAFTLPMAEVKVSNVSLPVSGRVDFTLTKNSQDYFVSLYGNGKIEENATVTPIVTVVNGVCGSANGTTVATKPTTNLCNSGTASAVAGTGQPWTWTCTGLGVGSSNASCFANKSFTCNPGWTYNPGTGKCELPATSNPVSISRNSIEVSLTRFGDDSSGVYYFNAVPSSNVLSLYGNTSTQLIFSGCTFTGGGFAYTSKDGTGWFFNTRSTGSSFIFTEASSITTNCTVTGGGRLNVSESTDGTSNRYHFNVSVNGNKLTLGNVTFTFNSYTCPSGSTLSGTTCTMNPL